jgi:quercetin dioxygenase-like cupin family protein
MSTTARLKRLRIAASALILGALPLCGPNALADEAKSKPPVRPPLLSKDLVGVPNKEALMLTVEYAPGASSAPHRHDAQVFVYVLEGSIIMQVAGKEPVTLKPGDTFYESPDDIHAKSANASQTEPAKFVVFIVKDKGKPVTRPAN